MKIAVALALVVIATSAIAVSAMNSKQSKPFKIVLSSPQSTTAAGKEIVVRVQMTNTSDTDLDCSSAYSNGIDLRYRFKVHGPNGKLISKKKVRHPELEGAGSFVLCTLKPGQSTQPEDNLISRRFNMSEPGEYAIEVERGISSDEKKGFVKSNSITVTVSAP